MDAVDELVVEVDVTKITEEEAQKIMGVLGRLPEGEQLSAHLSPKTYEKLKARCKELGIDIKLFAPLRPWLVSVTLTTLKLTMEGYSAEAGVDRLMLRAAHQKKKPVRALETLESQLRLFADQSAQREELYLVESLIATEKGRTGEFEAMVQSYEQGDAQALQKQVFASFEGNPELQPLFDALFKERNVQMLESLKRYSQESKRFLVTVGVGHMLGDDGLVAMLKKSGYEVERVRSLGAVPVDSVLGWVPFTGPDFKIEFPEPPKSQQQRQRTQAGDIQVVRHRVNRGLIVYELIVTHFPEAIAEAVKNDPEQLFKNIPETLSQRLQAKLIERKKLRFGGLVGQSLRFETPGGQMIERVFLKGGKLFEARVTYAGKGEKGGLKKDAERFLKSFGPL